MAHAGLVKTLSAEFSGEGHKRSSQLYGVMWYVGQQEASTVFPEEGLTHVRGSSPSPAKCAKGSSVLIHETCYVNQGLLE